MIAVDIAEYAIVVSVVAVATDDVTTVGRGDDRRPLATLWVVEVLLPAIAAAEVDMPAITALPCRGRCSY